MREEVERLDFFEGVAGLQEFGEVAHLGGGVAGDVDDAARSEGEELVEEGVAAAGAGGIDDDGSVAGRVGDVFKNVFGAAGLEGGVGDLVDLGVVGGTGGGAFGDFNAGDGLEMFGAGEGEEAGAAVGVKEMGGTAGGGFASDVIDEGGEDVGVVLEEVAGFEFEADAVDDFDGDVAGFGEDVFLTGAHEEGGGAFVALGVGTDIGADDRKFFVDLGHGDVAVGDIDDAVAAGVGEETDFGDLAVAGLLEVGGDFGAVVELGGGGDDRFDGVFDAAHVFEEFGDLLLFPGELGIVVEVLVLAAAAGAEEGAAGIDAVRRGVDDADEVGVGVVFVIAVDAGEDAFAGKGEGDHDDPAVHAGDALGEVGEFFDVKGKLLVIGERDGVEFFGSAGCG